MIECSTITILDEFGQLDTNCPSETEIISFELDLAGKTVDFRINVADKQAKLADIVPLARRVSTKLAILFLEKLKNNGQSIPCCKGCSACCSYLVPLSVPEVFRLREELLAMPPAKSNQILKSCTIAAKKILDKSSENLFASKITKSNLDSAQQLNKWYAELKLPCPFLSDNLCTLYEERPLACREHLVSGSSFFCQLEDNGEPNVVPIRLSILDALGQLTAELENSDAEAVMLPLAFAWSQDNFSRSEHTWPAILMVKRFAEILKELSAKNSSIPSLST